MKHLLFKLQSFLVLLVFTAVSAYAQKSPVDMNRFIDDLMNRSRRLKKVVWVFLSYLVWMLFMDMKRCFPFLWDCRVHGI